MVAVPSQIEIIHTGHMNSKMQSMFNDETGEAQTASISLSSNQNSHRPDAISKSRTISTTSETAALLPRRSDDSRFSLDLDMPEFEVSFFF